VPASPSAPPTSGAPRTDAEVPAYWRSLGLPGLADIQVPFLPERLHKPGMVVWLNAWCAEFADRVEGAVRCATLYPEPGAGDLVERYPRVHGARLLGLENGDG